MELWQKSICNLLYSLIKSKNGGIFKESYFLRTAFYLGLTVLHLLKNTQTNQLDKSTTLYKSMRPKQINISGKKGS